MTRSTASGRPGGHATENGGLGSRFSLTDEGRSGGMQTLEGPSQGRGIFAGAKTGYVVLRIEPRSASRPLRASSAFPTLTGSMPLAAGLAGPPVGHTAAASGHPRPADPCPGARSAEDPPAPCGRLVDKSAHRDTWGAFIDTWGAEYPGALQTLEGQTSVFSLARLGQVPAGARRGQVMHRNCA